MEDKVYAKGRTNNYEAYGIFDGKGLVVKKGSRVSEKIAANVNPIVLKKKRVCVLRLYYKGRCFIQKSINCCSFCLWKRFKWVQSMESLEKYRFR